MTAPAEPAETTALEAAELGDRCARLTEQVEALQLRLHKSEDRRRALLHIMTDMQESNKRLANQRKAMLHILGDYESERRQLARQKQKLQQTRRALLHILTDSHSTNERLSRSRKAMIHIMDDLRDTTLQMEHREQELREKQEQLVQAAKLATLGELTTGVAHELNNPLNNIGLFTGNVIDLVKVGRQDKERILGDLEKTMQQVRKATQIISHLRTFGRAAPVSREPLDVNAVVEQALSLMGEQLRVRGIEAHLDLTPDGPLVLGNAIQLEQVFLNLLSNARDALADSPRKAISVSSRLDGGIVRLAFRDTGPGIPPELEQRVFDPFFTTKDVGAGTGLGLSITYGIVRDHGGSISVDSRAGEGATFVVELPVAGSDAPEDTSQ